MVPSSGVRPPPRKVTIMRGSVRRSVAALVASLLLAGAGAVAVQSSASADTHAGGSVGTNATPGGTYWD